MKVFVTTIIAVAIAGTAFAQGTVYFANLVGSGPSTTIFVPVYGPNPVQPSRMQQGNAITNTTNPGIIDYRGHPVLQGTGFTAALFGGPLGTEPASLPFVASTPFSTQVSQSGVWARLTNAVPGVNPGGNATLQVRAWDNVGGTVTTWAAAVAGRVPRGFSKPFTAFELGDPNDSNKRPANLVVTDPASPNYRVGMTSFNIGFPSPTPNAVHINLESSTNMMQWLLATNGIYGPLPREVFFRMKIEPVFE